MTSFYMLRGCSTAQLSIRKLKEFLSVWLKEWKSKRIENGGRIEKWNDRKDFIFSPICLVNSEKVEGMEKMDLNNFTHISLLKNDAQLKQKSDK